MGDVRLIGGAALIGDPPAPVDDAVVVVSGERIVAAAARNDVPSADGGSEVIDVRGHTVIAGFIDAHVHIGLADPGEVVRGGVTTVRDLGWPPQEIFSAVRRSSAPDFVGPTILAAGPMLTAPGGYPTRAAWAPAGTGLELDGPRAADDAVAAVAARGGAIVKIALNPPVGPVLDAATVGAIVQAAHARGLAVTGHIHGLDQLDKALDAGIDELAHMLMSDEPLPGSTVARMVEQGVAIVPTLSIRSGHDLHTAIDNLARFRDAGGTIVYGTDLGNQGPAPGIDAREVTRMAGAGMSALEIVASATTTAARRLCLRDVGVLAPGAYADIAVVGNGAAQRVEALTRVAMVWRRGDRAV